MNEAAKRAVALLMASFRQEEFSEETAAVYVNHLNDIQEPLLVETVRKIIQTSKFFPSIAEIRETAARLAGLLPAPPAEALAIVRAADVPEDKFDRAGNYCYTERYWRWPPDLDGVTLDSIRATLTKVGDPIGRDGKPHFGWDMGFQKTYEGVAQETSRTVLADLSRIALPAPHKMLKEPPKELGA